MAKYTTINTQLPLALVVAALLLAGCAGYSQGGAQQTGGAGAAGGAGTGTSAAGGAGSQQAGGAGATGGAGTGAQQPPGAVLYASSQYAGKAIEVYPATGTGGPSAGEIPNFDLASAPQPDGSTKVTMTEKSGGQALSAVVPAGGSLYFYDANPGDDAAGSDQYLQDDKLVVVGSNGYIVQG